MLTGSPACRAPQVVTSSVCGISRISNSSPSTALTVSDVPSSATEPLTAMNLASAAGRAEAVMRHAVEVAPRHGRGEAVDVAADHVAAEFVADPKRPFEVELRSLAPGAERCHRECLRPDVERQARACPRGFDGDHRQANARVGDRGADGDGRGIVAARDRQPAPLAKPFDVENFADVADNSGEHEPSRRMLKRPLLAPQKREGQAATYGSPSTGRKRAL